MIITDAEPEWADLARRLSQRYGPLEAARRLDALVLGECPDLIAWRALGKPKRASA